MRKNKWIALLISVLTLTGCKAVTETFEKVHFTLKTLVKIIIQISQNVI